MEICEFETNSHKANGLSDSTNNFFSCKFKLYFYFLINIIKLYLNS